MNLTSKSVRTGEEPHIQYLSMDCLRVVVKRFQLSSTVCMLGSLERNVSMNFLMSLFTPPIFPYCSDMDGSRKFHQGGPEKVFFLFSHQRISQRTVRTSLEKQCIGPKVSNCFSREVLPVFLRKAIATCDFPGRVWTPCPPVVQIMTDKYTGPYHMRQHSVRIIEEINCIVN